ncbi:MAG: hypothetical protein D6768_15310 [Chloroflexi bacterium]|nr:MAG: hypothetical protein D6768_15310 [Chloroflexota bacterium]
MHYVKLVWGQVFVIGTILLVVICGVALAVAIAAVVLLVRAGERDGVSSARQDWIQRRSDDDEREW